MVFANEPIFQVEGPLAQCQLVETALLNILNYQILIATKAARIRSVIEDAPLLEFGTRRAQEMDAAIWGTRAAVIGGADATSNVRAGKIFGIPVSGTHAHALVQAYGNDYDAFKAYASTHKDCVFLVDTYDTLKIGVPNAIRVAKELGDKINFLGVRLDSGDLAYLSKQVRKQLDAAGFPDAKIYASNDLDENTILNLKMQRPRLMSGEWVLSLSLPMINQPWVLSTRLSQSRMIRVSCMILSNCPTMLRRYQHQVRSKSGVLRVVLRANQKVTISLSQTRMLML